MQSYDENNKLLKSMMVEEMKSVQEEMAKEPVRKIVLGKLPKKGEIIQFNDLQFLVTHANNKKGKIIAEILKPHHLKKKGGKE